MCKELNKALKSRLSFCLDDDDDDLEAVKQTRFFSPKVKHALAVVAVCLV